MTGKLIRMATNPWFLGCVLAWAVTVGALILGAIQAAKKADGNHR